MTSKALGKVVLTIDDGDAPGRGVQAVSGAESGRSGDATAPHTASTGSTCAVPLIPKPPEPAEGPSKRSHTTIATATPPSWLIDRCVRVTPSSDARAATVPLSTSRGATVGVRGDDAVGPDQAGRRSESP